METLVKTIQVIHIDAENRRICMKEIGHYSELGLAEENDCFSFIVREVKDHADVIYGQHVNSPYGFRIWHNGKQYVINGSAYIHGQKVIGGNLGDDEISTLLPVDYVIKGTGPVPGKMVVQFIGPDAGRNPAVQEQLDELRDLRNMAISGMATAAKDGGYKDLERAIYALTDMIHRIDLLSDKEVRPYERDNEEG